MSVKKYKRNNSKKNGKRSNRNKRTVLDILASLWRERKVKIALAASVAICCIAAITVIASSNPPRPVEQQPVTVNVVVPKKALALDFFEGLKKNHNSMVKAYQSRNLPMDINCVKMDAVNLVIDGQRIATFKTEREANKVLDYFKLRYVEECSKIIDVRFAQKVDVVPVKVEIATFDGFDDVEEVKQRIEVGTSELRQHIVQAGENYWIIAQNYGITVEELEQANPDIAPENLVIGQVVNLVAPRPILTVITEEEIKYSEDIAYDTIYEDSDELYKGETRIKVSGTYGEAQYQAKLVKHNGQIVSRDVVSEEIISEPISKVVYMGTMDPPPRMGTGVFGYPLPYYCTVSSEFGETYGRWYPHRGIDLVCPEGTNVLAADGGTVVTATWIGSYGYIVIIDHGGGLETVYAHLSEIIVSVGEEVFKGQTIAYSGNTGYTTGPHLHFEVREWGVLQNPRNYLDF